MALLSDIIIPLGACAVSQHTKQASPASFTSKTVRTVHTTLHHHPIACPSRDQYGCYAKPQIRPEHGLLCPR